MSLPLATTTISVYSRIQGDSPDVPYAAVTTAERKQLKISGVRAVLSIGKAGGSGNEVIVAGAQQAIAKFKLHCDPCDINNTDIVVDEITKQQYEILWVVEVQGLGFNYMRGEVTFSKGTEYADS